MAFMQVRSFVGEKFISPPPATMISMSLSNGARALSSEYPCRWEMRMMRSAPSLLSMAASALTAVDTLFTSTKPGLEMNGRFSVTAPMTPTLTCPLSTGTTIFAEEAILPESLRDFNEGSLETSMLAERNGVEPSWMMKSAKIEGPKSKS